MQCEFKQKDPINLEFCKVIQGYCQFQRNGFEAGHDCPIKQNYINFNNAWINDNKDKDGVTHVTYIEADDGNPETADINTNILDITIED